MQTSTERILSIFKQINRIPRKSKHEEKISQWLVDWAVSHNLEVRRDDVNNVFINVPATPGYDDKPILIIQGHMDMVCEKVPESNHDFSKDPIKMVYEGEWLRADGTTLGADNGIALAYALAIVEDGTLEHPPLEFCFTVDEETGLTGANALKPNTLKGKILLNLDSEEEGVFTIGCCGGQDTHLSFPLEYEELKADHAVYRLSLSGCRGGHSGEDIAKHRSNANKLLSRICWELKASADAQLISVTGGTAHNAIPRDAEALITLKKDDKVKADEIVAKLVKDFLNEYIGVETKIAAKLTDAKTGRKPIKKNLTDRILKCFIAFPSGINEMMTDGSGLAETSNNFAMIRTEEDKMTILSSQRSLYMSKRNHMTRTIEMLADLSGAEYQSGNGYSSWQPNYDSLLLEKSKKIYHDLFGEKPAVNVIHGGLECGVIGAKHDGMDMISIGPTINNPHSPEEELNIPSVEKVWDFLIVLLKTL